MFSTSFTGLISAKSSLTDMTMLLIVVVCVSFATDSHAFTRFESTCTIPPSRVNFVSSPDSRGILDIFWSCLFTIIACTWTIQHLNIPKQRGNLRETITRRDVRKERKWLKSFRHRLWSEIVWGAGDLKWVARDFWTNLKWMLFTMVAPEFILLWATSFLLGD